MAQWFQHPRPDGSGYWRNNAGPPQLYGYAVGSHAAPIEVRLAPLRKADSFQVVVALETEISVAVELNEVVFPHPPTPSPTPGRGGEQLPGGEGIDLTLTIDGHGRRLALAHSDETWWVQTRSGIARLRALPRLPAPHPPADAGG
jgi:hypothetical protein